ncbi:MAG: (2Fe-2S) ferredoxin domain-containing protein [Thermotoga sp.]|nr:MAG: (2Fe-2S) ferredoxin domain-containing protein [Thermotoga sp.]
MMKSLEELKRIKEKKLRDLKFRDTNKRGEIIVAMGTCGIAAGAKETLEAIIKELDERNINDFAVVQSGCMGLCEVEPTVKVIIDEKQPIIYGHVDPLNAHRIIEQHIVNGKVVEDLVVKRGDI